MPTPEWNRRWVDEMNAKKGLKNQLYYGGHWGDPDPATVFPRRLQPFVPEGVQAMILQNDAIRKFLNKRRGKDTGYQPELYTVLKEYLRPYVNENTTVLEIGPGGGRWTNYMLHAKHLTLVELNTEFFDYLKERFGPYVSKFRFYQTRDYELEGVESSSIDFVFTFGTFVHIDPEGIQGYMREIARVMKPGGYATLQYADKTKELAQNKPGFSDMTPAKMEGFVKELPGMEIVKHDTGLLLHSSVVMLHKKS